ncbi:MAG: endonuclease III [bacterium]|nr:endonuclease III [bacterium]
MARFKLTQTANRERAAEVLKRLRKVYPDARCSLDYDTPLQLLVATILAAQCTDIRVNIVTKDLFKTYPTAQAFVDASQEELEAAVRTCGFYRNKAKSIKKACAALVEHHDGQVPDTMDELLQLEGVGRKTANVLLGECFTTQGIVVDTHCGRLAKRLRFTKHDDPVKVEQDLIKILPRDHWTIFSHSLVFHGRAICASRAPKCSQCPLDDQCPFPTSPEGKRIAK